MTLKQYSVLLSRISLFIIYFWFGFLKIIGLSPASGMVQELFGKTVTPMMNAMHMSFMTPGTFVIVFGIIEVVIGILFLIPGKEKLATSVFSLHMITTGMPLFFLKSSVWTHIFVPTLEGQYIIKNIALIACALTIYSAVEENDKKVKSTI
jgi:uncharacterized membrane protein YkgB